MIYNYNSDKKVKLIISNRSGLLQYENIWKKTNDLTSNFFLTWDWIGTWLYTFSVNNEILFFHLEESENVIGSCFFCIESKRRLCFINQRLYVLNTSINNPGASTCIEYNNFLIPIKNNCENFTNKLLNSLVKDKRLKWDLVYIPYMQDTEYKSLRAVAEKYQFKISNETRDTSYFTDLTLFKNVSEFFNILPKSNKTNILQNLARYQKYGHTKIKAATEIQEALQFFLKIRELNIERFRKIGTNSVFEIPEYIDFHMQLITETLTRNKTSLVKIEVGDILVGIIYSYIHNNDVLFYQSGFNYNLESRLSPGIFSLYNLMKYYSDLGYNNFYFLAGNADYKRRLSTGKHELVSFEFQNNNLKNKMIERISRFKKLIVK